jgi:dephospho-CoA kinase
LAQILLMKRVGITGNIGSGKSTVAAIFALLNVPVYNADYRAKTLMTENALLVQQIKHIFGNEAYENGQLNRAYIASKAFTQKELLEQLNDAVHPAVFEDFDEWCLSQKTAYIVKEAALMFESDSYKQLDEIIVVTAPKELRIARTIARDGISKEAVENRMRNQMSESEKKALSQYEIINDEQMMIIPQVLSLHQLFLKNTSEQ